MAVIEGYVDYDVPAAGKPCKTWYKAYGDLKSRRPLVLLHGGPGVTHSYLLKLSLLYEKYSIPLVFYDQIGNGKSTHLPEKNGDDSFWTPELLQGELDNLLSKLGIRDDYDLFGSSWGGMLASMHAIRQPTGLKHLIIASSPASMKLWVEAQNKLRSTLSQDIQDVLEKGEENGTADSEEYENAVNVFYSNFLCRVQPMPAEVAESLGSIKEDPTVYLTMNGPNEFSVTGSLKTWSVIPDIHKINAPTLLTNGRFDEAQDSVMQPFFDNISKVKWITFSESSHMAHVEETDRYTSVLAEFLK